MVIASRNMKKHIQCHFVIQVVIASPALEPLAKEVTNWGNIRSALIERSADPPRFVKDWEKKIILKVLVRILETRWKQKWRQDAYGEWIQFCIVCQLWWIEIWCHFQVQRCLWNISSPKIPMWSAFGMLKVFNRCKCLPHHVLEYAWPPSSLIITSSRNCQV